MKQITNYTLLAMGLVIAVALTRVCLTYRVYNNTIDEPINIWLSTVYWKTGRVPADPINPPVGRFFAGIGPAVVGSSPAAEFSYDEPPRMLYEDGRYWARLTTARMGTLVYFVGALLLVWQWGRKLNGTVCGLTAALVLSLTPHVLGHAGMAATDMAHLTMFGLSVYVFTLWIDRPTWRRTILVGLVSGLAFCTKLSMVILLPVLYGMIALVRRWAEGAVVSHEPKGHLAGRLLAAIACCGLAIWSVYLFDMGSLVGPGHRPPYAQVDKIFGKTGLLHDAAEKLIQTPVPAPRFWEGLHRLVVKNHGEARYFLGQIRNNRGDPRFFPLGLLTKTPVTLLILYALGFGAVAWRGIRGRDWHLLVPGLAAGLILGVAMLSNINIGLRHIIPIYLFLSVLAGIGLSTCWNSIRRSPSLMLALGMLLVGAVLDSASAHPDYIYYFNALARNHPEALFVESDLDWGQDLQRLAEEVKARQLAKPLHVAFWGTAIPENHLVNFVRLEPNERVSGWVAVSVMYLKCDPGYQWLNQYEPTAIVGKSIWLFYVPPLMDDATAAPSPMASGNDSPSALGRLDSQPSEDCGPRTIVAR
jgi:hypothetical protein